jgi:hypothetical protein
MLLIKQNLRVVIVLLIFAIASPVGNAQFLDAFNGDKIQGWFFFTGDGKATIDFIQREGYAQLIVDGSQDKYNVYWALIKRDVTPSLDLSKLKDPTYELRVEARVRVHNAPRRLNFMVNTQRTTDYHKDLMEFDIPDTINWHVISMTTRDFDAIPGDTVYVQLAATDFGDGKYCVDLDYYRADIVDIKTAGPDKGVQVPYHPPIPDTQTFSHHLPVDQDCIINTDFPDVNFNDWHTLEAGNITPLLTVNAHQWIVLKWNFAGYTDVTAKGAGVLEITTHSVFRGGNYDAFFGKELGMEFGKIRVIEIIGGNAGWNQLDVTYNNLTDNSSYSEVFNTQMVYDTEVVMEKGGKNYITISKPIMQRLFNGTTKGLLIRPLGAIDASIYASEFQTGLFAPKLHFNINIL